MGGFATALVVEPSVAYSSSLRVRISADVPNGW
jgi:hypothetical protein